MRHPFGDLLTQHLHRKHGLSQAKLAAGILQDPSIIAKMCKGQRLTGVQARERVLLVAGWLHKQGVLSTVDEANALLAVADMLPLKNTIDADRLLAQSLSSASQHPLPATKTQLLGREADTRAAKSLLNRHDVRQVSLLGPPGVGKTRLALQVAQESSADFADGVCFVALAPIHDSALIASAIAQALALSAAGQNPLDVVKQYVRDKRILLVLDNLEQLLDEANATNTASVIADILAIAPMVKMLITSRAAMRMDGDHVFEVQPLNAGAAGELFVQRVQAIKPTFLVTKENQPIIADICQRLDGLPLAIELAAARIRLFEPAALLAQLSSQLGFLTHGAMDLAPRQRTLRNTIDWSYDLLAPEEQTLFRRLGVFAGGCTLAAIEYVAGEGLTTPAMELMQSLVDKSLIKTEPHDDTPRFGLLEMLHEYALERLEQMGELDATQQRHAAYFLGLVEGKSLSLRHLDLEQDNTRAVLRWALVTERIELGLQFVAAMDNHWFRMGRNQEGWGWISQLTAHPAAQAFPLARGRALKAAIQLLLRLGDNALAMQVADECVTLFRVLDDKASLAWVLVYKGDDAWTRAEYADARKFCDESARLFRGLDEGRGLARALSMLAGAVRDQGEYDAAAKLFHESINAAFQADADAVATAFDLGLADLAYHMGDVQRSDVLFEQVAKELAQKSVSDDIGRHLAIALLGRNALTRGDVSQAVAHLEASEAAFRKVGNKSSLCTWVLPHLSFARHLQGNEDAANNLMQEALTVQQQMGFRWHLALSLEVCAAMAVDRKQPDRAARLFGAAEALRKRIAAPVPLAAKPLVERYVAAARDALAHNAFGAYWEAGYAMSLDQAVAFAMSDGP